MLSTTLSAEIQSELIIVRGERDQESGKSVIILEHDKYCVLVKSGDPGQGQAQSGLGEGRSCRKAFLKEDQQGTWDEVSIWDQREFVEKDCGV